MSFAFSNTKPDLTSSDYTERKKGVTRYAYLRSLAASPKVVPYSNYDGTVIMANSKIISVRSYDELLNITKGSYIKPHKDCSLSIICPSYQSSGNIGENTYTTVSSDFSGTDTPYTYIKRCDISCTISGIDIDPSGGYSDCNTNLFYHMKKMNELKIDVSLANNNYRYRGFRFPAPIRLRTMKEITSDASCVC
jgi:hypothetical protein